MKTDKKEFIEPILIKAGSDLLRLGQMKTKPKIVTGKRPLKHC
jgi:hypothetical protein